MNNYNCLDLNIIKDKVKEFAAIDEAKSFIENEEICFNPLVIKQKLSETQEAINIIDDNINVQFSGIKNINDYLDKAEKGITLSGMELKDCLVFHNNCVRIKKIFDSLDNNLRIKDYSDSLSICSNVFTSINNAIENSGELKVNASGLLRDINNNIDILNKRLYTKGEQFIHNHTSSLQEPTIYVRDNRITFLIKNSDKNKYDGYAYGSSASGLASYVEPQSFVEMNNEMIELLEKRINEQNRILRELTYLVSTVSEEYRKNFDSLLKLNVIFAKANYGINNNCIVASINESNYHFDFKDLCHPLIDVKTVVSNNYRLYDPYNGIVISGSNTGGKTVSLKSIGLSILMSYIGIPIIASEASIPIYQNIYVDIDDNQSIQNSLSTFSAHISNINYILNNANNKCLILIDELISGTDPKEAQAISLAILDKIKHIGSKFIITTHFDDIKEYSYNDEHILLSSVGFNTNELKPTYKYYENSIGSSNALEIASRYFDDINIVDNAKKYLKSNETKQEALIKKLSFELEELNSEKNKLKELIDSNNQLNIELNNKNSQFETEKELLKQEYIEEVKQYVNDIKNKALEKLESIKDRKDIFEVKEFEKILDDNSIKNETIVFNIGDNVRIKDNEQIGTIISIKNGIASVDIRGLTIKTNVNDLTLMPKITRKEVYKEKKRYTNVPKEINLVGERVEDGLVLMEEYLDRANAANLSSVKVIHGIGSGSLRSCLRERLKKLSYVSSFKDGDFYDGGSAVTIVEFK